MHGGQTVRKVQSKHSEGGVLLSCGQSVGRNVGGGWEAVWMAGRMDARTGRVYIIFSLIYIADWGLAFDTGGSGDVHIKKKYKCKITKPSIVRLDGVGMKEVKIEGLARCTGPCGV